MLRVLNFLAIAALVCAAAYVYKIKYEATLQAEQVAKKRAEIRRERDGIAILRAEWAKLDSPDRIEALAKRHLALRPIEATQIDSLERLPERPSDVAPPANADPIGALLETFADPDAVTGTAPGPAKR